MYGLVTFQFLVLHDLVDVVPRSNGRRDWVRVQHFHIFVSTTGQMESSRTSPSARAHYQD
jgi:hypothetical protein